ncbi:MAG: helix-turn-helix transcriptional regulator [Bdellovibrionales bacterium]|nr:helix-turn-helix transcriptional regulator [Bdellovibrionales bacterium]
MNLEKNVITDTYRNGITYLESGVIVFERDHTWKAPTELIDVFSHCWSVTFGDFHQGDLGAYREGHVIKFNGFHCFLIPPFTTVHWKIQSSKLKWKSFIFLSSPQFQFPQVAQAFSLKGIPDLKSSEDLKEFIAQLCTKESGTCIDNLNKESSVAVTTRQYINKNFKNDFSIKEMANQLGYSHSVMSRYFKKCYSMSVIQYRNQLRLFDSLLTLLQSQKPIYKVAHESGHQDISRYYRRFKDFFGASPSAYHKDQVPTIQSEASL